MTSTSLRSIRAAAADKATTVDEGSAGGGADGGVWQADASMAAGITRKLLILVMLYTITRVNVGQL
jgi:hypothetical protein